MTPPMLLPRFLAIRGNIRVQSAIDYATLGTLAPMTAVAVELAEELERRVVARVDRRVRREVGP